MNHHIVRNVGFALGLIPPIILVSLTNTYFNQSGLNFDKIMTAIISISFGALPMIIGGAYMGYKKRDFYVKLKYVYAVAFSIIYVILFFHFGYQYVEKHFICRGEAGCLEEVSQVTPMVSNDEVPLLLRRPPQINDTEDMGENHEKSYEQDQLLPSKQVTVIQPTPTDYSKHPEAIALIELDKRMDDAAAQGNWQDYIRQAEKISEIGINYLAITFGGAIRMQAPLYVIEALLRFGLTLEPNLRSTVIFYGGSQRLADLVARGMSLSERDAYGDNALINAARAAGYPDLEYTANMMSYILTVNSDVNATNNEGMTPLSYLIKKSDLHELDGFIQLFLDHGAQVMSHHRQQLAVLKHESPDAYNTLKQRVPELFDQ